MVSSRYFVDGRARMVSDLLALRRHLRVVRLPLLDGSVTRMYVPARYCRVWQLTIPNVFVRLPLVYAGFPTASMNIWKRAMTTLLRTVAQYLRDGWTNATGFLGNVGREDLDVIGFRTCDADRANTYVPACGLSHSTERNTLNSLRIR